MSFLETRIPIKLGGQDVVLTFNANTFAAYEEATGKFFLDTAATLYDALKPFLPQAPAAQGELPLEEAAAPQEATAPTTVPTSKVFEVLRKVSIKDLRALIWSAAHDYDESGEPHWPLTLNEVGRRLRPLDIPQIFMSFAGGMVSNSPTVDEVGESPAAPAVPSSAIGAPPKKAAGGGERSTELPVDAFA